MKILFDSGGILVVLCGEKVISSRSLKHLTIGNKFPPHNQKKKQKQKQKQKNKQTKNKQTNKPFLLLK